MSNTRYHHTTLGKFLPAETHVDINGYVPLPGAKLEDHGFDLSHFSDPEAEFARMCAENKLFTDQAEREI